VNTALDAAVTVPAEIYAACKTSGPEFLWTGADQLVQLLGARGYTETNLVSQLLRDARLLRIFEGPTETLHMFLGSGVLKRSRAFYEFIDEQLGAADVGRELDAAARTISDRFGAAGTLFRDRASAVNWVHERTGVLATYAVLRAALQRARARAAAPEIERALTWAKLRFDQTLRDIFAAGDGAAVLQDADALLRVGRDYAQSIGDIEQTLAGEATGLDPLLQREHSGIKLVSEAAQPVAGPARPASAVPVPMNDTVHSVQAWIIDWMAQRLNLARDMIRPQDPFAQFGWDSVDAVQLAHDVGEWLQHDVDPTLMWNFPTIAALATHLAPLVLDAPVSSTAVRTEVR
jgi:acyl carrier protein